MPQIFIGAHEVNEMARIACTWNGSVGEKENLFSSYEKYSITKLFSYKMFICVSLFILQTQCNTRKRFSELTLLGRTAVQSCGGLQRTYSEEQREDMDLC